MFKDNTYSGVTFTVMRDGGIRLSGTCTMTTNCKQDLKNAITGNFSLSCESNVDLTDKISINLRDRNGVSISNMPMKNKRSKIVTQTNSIIEMIDITVVEGTTYDCVLYIQLLSDSHVGYFVSPYSAKDDVARKILDSDTFVTPQMYGAAGNGTIDDSDAIQEALNSGKNVYIPEGTYLINKTIKITPSFMGRKLYGASTANNKRSFFKTTVFPCLNNDLSGGYTISGISFISDNFPSLESLTEAQQPYIMLTNSDTDDIDVVIENCTFENNFCMITTRGRNIIIRNNLFWNMGSRGCCIFLSYPDIPDGEEDIAPNTFRNRDSGFRGIIIEGNRCHYTRNWLVDTSHPNCKYIKGLVIRNNYLEGTFCVHGYLNNALVTNNISHQTNHYDSTDQRIDACFSLFEMKNSIIDNYFLTGSDTYVTLGGNTVDEHKLGYFIRVSGECIGNIITNIFVSNYLYGVFFALGECSLNRMQFNIRKTRTTSFTIAFNSKLSHNMIDVVINDIRTEKDIESTIVQYKSGMEYDNIVNVLANFECIKFGVID